MKFINLGLNYFLRLILIKDSPLEKPFPFVVNNDHIGKQILIDGFYERFYIENIINYLDTSVFSNTMVDVGANIGNHSVFFSKYFNQIVSFEPQKRTFQILEMNCSYIRNIKIFNYGLSSSNKKLKFKIHKMNFGNAKEFDGKSEKDFFIEEVELKKHRFDKIHKISLIKIDVEGSECDVIKSMENEIINFKPIILFEYNDNKIKEPIISQLNRLGYRDFFVFKKELIKSPFLKLFTRSLSKLKKIDLSPQNNFSMVVTQRRDSDFLLKNIF